MRSAALLALSHELYSCRETKRLVGERVSWMTTRYTLLRRCLYTVPNIGSRTASSFHSDVTSTACIRATNSVGRPSSHRAE